MNPTIEAWFTVAGVPYQDGYQWIPSIRLTTVYHPTVEVELPLLVTGLAAESPWPHLCKTLGNAYPAAHPIYLLQAVDGNPSTVLTTTLGVLESAAPTALSVAPTGALCVPPLPEGSSFSALQAIVAHLRSPLGCPWDREQTLFSMRHDLLGECAEVIEAIDHELDGTDNGEHIAEELGDLFMAGVLILQIAIDEGRFQLADAMQSIVTKLIRRHPHVFGDTEVDGVDAIWANWDQIKQQEKRDKGKPIGHPLDGVPEALPALEKARELQSKAAKADLLDRAALAASLDSTLDIHLKQGSSDGLTEQTLGTLLWTLVAVAQQRGLNAEDALRSYCVQFRKAHVTVAAG